MKQVYEQWKNAKNIVVLEYVRLDIILTLPAPFISESCIKIKINLNFYFHTSLWCLKNLYEGL